MMSVRTHGWPGSVIELLDTVGPLTEPTAHGGSAEDAFHLVLPSLPGYGLSGEPVEGWDLGRTARAWAELMRRLGYTRYVAQGGDVGAGVTDAMGREAPEGLIGIHTNLLVPALSGTMPTDTDESKCEIGERVGYAKALEGRSGRTPSSAPCRSACVIVRPSVVRVDDVLRSAERGPPTPEVAGLVPKGARGLEPARWRDRRRRTRRSGGNRRR
jgi:pimeloyl-ACP methyl ester carboxylesterase